MRRSEDENRLDHIIDLSGTHRASDPRDKIFALESLLPKCMSRLLHIDYNESCEYVFKRVTARLYNDGGSLLMATKFHFLFDSHTNTTSPSWVLDFTYNDMASSDRSTSALYTNTVTLEEYIYETSSSHPVEKEKLFSKQSLATPTTIFCFGMCIDYIWKAEQIKKA